MPIEKAERRVLVLANPGLGLENMQATPTIYVGMQLIMPGETAPNHRHTPSAVRFVVEGEGAATIVNGEVCPMEKGDLILTPPGLWHQHEHNGTGPVIWLDALDLPLVYALEASYCIEGPEQVGRNEADSSQTRFTRAGVLPYSLLRNTPPPYPLIRFPWSEVREALQAYGSSLGPDELVQLAYVNPTTGQPCLPILGFSAIMLRSGEERSLRRRSASAVLHVISGSGQAEIDGMSFSWDESDTLAVPTHAEVRLVNASGNRPAYLFVVDDAPMQHKLGFYEEF
ncbi:gentisate 1,2-dioxygenase (plasmid) [Rhizorhabdus wittichii RW1]|uniref:Gentisate 1,2-dioxygenase n=1 Tax=Rhizorhabdus wittichii (strain DSM 6014 / CCUG 31198 / JCM 15750 / NBRC 105917 / EY 4224 / RW1) TaxID=392499 RepID=A0A9J9HHB0_RHIWR|nr:gentisate 1,2-dioxygenase [Rhizorhabdus wittichii RW1]